MAIILALCSALAYGTSDYIGARTSRRFAPIVTTWHAELFLAPSLVAFVLFTEDTPITTRAVLLGLLAGVIGSVSVFGLYAALSGGHMTVVAPVSALAAAVVPVIAGLALGENPPLVVLLGIAVAVAAVGLIGGIVGASFSDVPRSTLALATLVGSGFGLLFVVYDTAGTDAGLWPLAFSRCTSVLFIGAMYWWSTATGRASRDRAGILLPSAATGLFVGAANVFFVLSTHHGMLTVVAVLTSLYPASTIALAAICDGERATKAQSLGMVLAVAAVVLIGNPF